MDDAFKQCATAAFESEKQEYPRNRSSLFQVDGYEISSLHVHLLGGLYFITRKIFNYLILSLIIYV